MFDPIDAAETRVANGRNTKRAMNMSPSAPPPLRKKLTNAATAHTPEISKGREATAGW